jgi:predicted nucleic acid-binding protein
LASADAVGDRIAVDALLDELHLGEAEAIVLARELSIGRILLDDQAARSRARLMSLTVTGTIGILLLWMNDQILNGEPIIRGTRTPSIMTIAGVLYE